MAGEKLYSDVVCEAGDKSWLEWRARSVSIRAASRCFKRGLGLRYFKRSPSGGWAMYYCSRCYSPCFYFTRARTFRPSIVYLHNICACVRVCVVSMLDAADEAGKFFLYWRMARVSLLSAILSSRVGFLTLPTPYLCDSYASSMP